MPSNIKDIVLWENNPNATNNIPLVKINFKFPCEWTTLNIEDLKNILELWIEGEERVYPQEKGFQGRWLLKQKIDDLFNK